MECFLCRKPKNYFKDFLRVKRLMNIVLSCRQMEGWMQGRNRAGKEGEKEGRREGKKKIDWKSHFLFWCPITLKRLQRVSYKNNPLWHYHHTTHPFRKPSHIQCCFPIHRLYFNFANDHINVSFSLLVQILV